MKMVLVFDMSQETTIDQAPAVTQRFGAITRQTDENEPIDKFRPQDNAAVHFESQPAIADQIPGALVHVVRLELLAREKCLWVH
jgi:hypothetical protein